MNKQIAALATDEKNMVMWDIDALLLDYKEHSYVTVDTEIHDGFALIHLQGI